VTDESCAGGPPGDVDFSVVRLSPCFSRTREPYTSRQATYDLRRLRRKQLIERFPHSNRSQLTPLGRRVAVLFT